MDFEHVTACHFVITCHLCMLDCRMLYCYSPKKPSDLKKKYSHVVLMEFYLCVCIFTITLFFIAFGSWVSHRCPTSVQPGADNLMGFFSCMDPRF